MSISKWVHIGIQFLVAIWFLVSLWVFGPIWTTYDTVATAVMLINVLVAVYTKARE
jgi:hypothetical protein